jgi:DNA-binding response OmpR family regulator
MTSRILVVDDDTALAEMIGIVLRTEGFDPVFCEDGSLAVDTFRSAKPDLVLLDLMLPDSDGFELCEQLKRNRDTNLIPVVMVTALNDPNHRLSGVRVGANGYLTKPFLPSQLFEAMDQALAWRDEHLNRGTTGEINFDVRSEITYLQQTNDMLSDLFHHTPLTERQIKDLKQVVMEMGGNAIEWGHRKNADLTVRITYRIDPEKVTLIIRDQGPGFNPNTVPHAASDDDPIGHLDIRNELGIREGGFGIMLAKGLVDDFHYNDKGNEVTLIKRFRQ